AEQQMRACIFYLTAFGYVDGDFNRAEKAYVRQTIQRLVEARAAEAMPDATATLRTDVVARFTRHFHEVFEAIDREVKSLLTEAVARDEHVDRFVEARLKLRSYEIFKSFDPANQEALLATIDELISADGEVHPAEVKFRDELRGLLAVEIPMDEDPLADLPAPPRKVELEVAAPAVLVPREDDHPFLRPAEQHYSADPVTIRGQAGADHKLLVATMKRLDEQRAGGQGRLTGHRTVDDFAGQAPFLDGHVYVHPLAPGKAYELTVLGDLHGCYSCLKGALLQSDFLAKVEAFRRDPEGKPEP